jgi:hypothetical protein
MKIERNGWMECWDGYNKQAAIFLKGILGSEFRDWHLVRGDSLNFLRGCIQFFLCERKVISY